MLNASSTRIKSARSWFAKTDTDFPLKSLAAVGRSNRIIENEGLQKYLAFPTPTEDPPRSRLNRVC